MVRHSAKIMKFMASGFRVQRVKISWQYIENILKLLIFLSTHGQLAGKLFHYQYNKHFAIYQHFEFRLKDRLSWSYIENTSHL